MEPSPSLARGHLRPGGASGLPGSRGWNSNHFALPNGLCLVPCGRGAPATTAHAPTLFHLCPQIKAYVTPEPIRLGQRCIAPSSLNTRPVGSPSSSTQCGKQLFPRRREIAGQTGGEGEGEGEVHLTAMIKFGPNVKDFDSSSTLITHSCGPHRPWVQ